MISDVKKVRPSGGIEHSGSTNLAVSKIGAGKDPSWESWLRKIVTGSGKKTSPAQKKVRLHLAHTSGFRTATQKKKTLRGGRRGESVGAGARVKNSEDREGGPRGSPRRGDKVPEREIASGVLKKRLTR